MIEVNIIGAGNVAWHLARAFASKNNAIVMQCAARDLNSLKDFTDFAQKTVVIKDLAPSEVTIIAVSDDKINEVYNQLPDNIGLVVHTSGFTSMDALSKDTPKDTSQESETYLNSVQKGYQRPRVGVFYPLQTFSKEDTSISFEHIPILVEAHDEKDEKTLRSLASTISSDVSVVTSAQRKQLHMAAVFANNFTNYCYTIAQEICQENQVPFNTLKPLILKTAEKAIENGPYKSQTGPAKRNDTKVIESQINALTNQSHRDIYTQLTKAITETYGKEL